jgi:hypothetical protein
MCLSQIGGDAANPSTPILTASTSNQYAMETPGADSVREHDSDRDLVLTSRPHFFGSDNDGYPTNSGVAPFLLRRAKAVVRVEITENLAVESHRFRDTPAVSYGFLRSAFNSLSGSAPWRNSDEG